MLSWFFNVAITSQKPMAKAFLCTVLFSWSSELVYCPWVCSRQAHSCLLADGSHALVHEPNHMEPCGVSDCNSGLIFQGKCTSSEAKVAGRDI